MDGKRPGIDGKSKDTRIRGRFVSKVSVYPKVSINVRKRGFNGKLLEKYDWLEWSEATNRMYCFLCYMM